MHQRRILDVGNCDADHGQIRALLESRFAAEVLRARTIREALEVIGAERVDLVLVNRVIFADAEEGVGLVRTLATRPSAPPVILLSNYPEAQAEARAAGARPGFGKAALRSPETVACIAAALSSERAAGGGAARASASE